MCSWLFHKPKCPSCSSNTVSNHWRLLTINWEICKRFQSIHNSPVKMLSIRLKVGWVLKKQPTCGSARKLTQLSNLSRSHFRHNRRVAASSNPNPNPSSCETKQIAQPLCSPDVGLAVKNTVLQWLRCHPTHRQQTLRTLPVVVRLIDVSCHAKICTANITQHCSTQSTTVTTHRLITNVYVPSHSTLRSSSSANSYVPRTSPHFSSRSFHIAAPTVWNSLPSTLRSNLSP